MWALTIEDVYELARQLIPTINHIWESRTPRTLLKACPIPRGGVPVLFALIGLSGKITVANNPEEADFFIDDIIDSGSTMEEWCDKYPGKPFLALIDKTDPNCAFKNDWVVFPWENSPETVPLNRNDDSIVGTITNRIRRAGAPFSGNDNICEYIKSPLEFEQLQDEVQKRFQSVLEALLIDTDNDHNTRDTSKRVAKMYLHEIFKGRYTMPPPITDFPNAKKLDEMYITGPISIRSVCSHHFVPIIGRCWIGVVPGERVIGLSKFNRLVEWIVSRGQIQEEMVVQIADLIEGLIKPQGLAVVVEASHLCMSWRGVQEPMDAKMTTNVMRGVFMSKPEARAEFLTFIKG